MNSLEQCLAHSWCSATSCYCYSHPVRSSPGEALSPVRAVSTHCLWAPSSVLPQYPAPSFIIELITSHRNRFFACFTNWQKLTKGKGLTSGTLFILSV